MEQRDVTPVSCQSSCICNSPIRPIVELCLKADSPSGSIKIALLATRPVNMTSSSCSKHGYPEFAKAPYSHQIPNSGILHWEDFQHLRMAIQSQSA